MKWEQCITDKSALVLLAMQRHSWEQGTAMQAFLEMGEMEIVTAMAREVALSKTDRWGYVHDACGAPTFDKPGYSPEA